MKMRYLLTGCVALVVNSVAAQSATAPPTAAAPQSAGVEGRWRGTLGNLRLQLDISKSSDGLYTGILISIDQGGSRIPIDRTRQVGDSVHFDIAAIAGAYHGALSADRTTMNGTWSQLGQAQPLAFTRAEPAAATAPVRTVSPATAATSPLGLLLEATTTPIHPIAVSSGGKQHLAYELHITNFSGTDLLLTRIEALSGGKSLASYEGSDLTAILQQLRPDVTDNRALSAGGRVVAFIWLTLDSGAAIPASIRHRVSSGTVTLETPSMDVSPVKPIVIGPPFRGSDWVARNGPSNLSFHRRALLALDGTPRIAQRFAIDWMKLGPNGSPLNGDPKDNKSYFGYGAELLAVGDGVVAAIKDGIPENLPGANSRAVPITRETVAGNHVIIDLGAGWYALYAHMQPGSLRVKVGDRVRRGQVIGLLGNSGNSTGPHLHFHITDGSSNLGAEGVPYVIDSWEIMTAPGTWERRLNQLPLADARVRFTPPNR